MKKVFNDSSRPNELTYEDLYNRTAIKVKYFDISLPEIKKIPNGDWIDLMSRETIALAANQSYLIPLNVAMKLPEGYEAYLVPRSGTFKKYGVIQTNGIGIIDNSYSGNNDEWIMPVYATRDAIINKGDRIAQFRIEKKMSNFFNIITVDMLDDTDRGGFGSTGI